MMKDLESFYPLSSTQQGLLFHSLLTPGSGVYVGQLVCRLEGRLSSPALRQAWQSVVDRHAALRTSFRWEDLKEPIQVVHRQAELPFEELDWRDVSEEEQAARLEELLRADRTRGFDLASAPLLRCLLIRLGEESWEFVWTRHHLIVDGWSVALLMKEVFASYAALLEGRRLALAAAPAYRDYIVWLRRQSREESEARWRRALAGVSAATPLSIERGDQGRAGAIDREERYGYAEARLSAATSAALPAVARRAGLTVNTLFQGAWALLLSRYSDSSDVVFGTVVSGRPPAVPGVESMVGLFINTQPLRAQVPPSGDLLAWLRSLQSEQASLKEDEHVSLQEIQAWSEVPRGQPLFESLLVFENFPVDATLRNGNPGDLRLGEIRAGERTNFPLTLVTGPSDPWQLAVSYDRGRFSSASIGRLIGHLEVVLDAMAEGLERPVETLSLLSASERAQILGDWNRTAEVSEGPSSIVEWVAAQVARTPEAVALRFEERELTYGELAHRARALAGQLRRLGAGPGTRVAVALERSEAMVVGLLGTLWSGAAYVPLDPAYPLERLGTMLSDSGAKVLLAEEGPVAAIAGPGCTRLAPTEWEEEPGDLPDLPPSLPCYVIYTSGSTGRPKGVEIPHGAVVNFLRAMQSCLGLTARDTLVAVTSLSFDIAGLELFLPLGVGARVLLASREVAADGVRLRRLIEQSGATILQATPSTWRLLSAAGFVAKPPFRQLCGGEALSRELADSLLAGGAELWNLYGPTETTIWSTAERVEAGPVSLGRPIRNTTVYVLDQAMRPVPVGVEGELYIGGEGLALGYAGQAGQTAERFVPDPFGTAGGRLYRTGDRVRWRSDSRLEYHGRMDHQVKLRGHRIELGEIESALEAHPAVSQAVVVVRQGPGGEPRLVAYVVATGSAEALRSHLEQLLPAIMVPSSYVFLSALPLTPNGKIDRKALPAPGGEERSVYEAPESQIERQVAEAWQEVLGLDRVGRNDNFFDLGGSSMLAIQVHHKLQRSLGLEVSLVDLFEHPTIARLAAALARSKPAAIPETVAVPDLGNAVAVIGMACRVPGARTVEQYWENLLGGVESITFFTREELLAAGVPVATVDDPRRIAARGCLEGIDELDAAFFGMTAREAELLDPQHRIFLECAWEALDRSGYGGEDTGGRVGVFAGASLNSYLLANVVPHLPQLSQEAGWQVVLGNDKDYLTTRVSYLLGLTGPSMLVQTACSTSLVAIHMARESIVRGECELALAGGVSAKVPQAAAQLYQEGGINSPDGHCRAFDASAQGTVGGNGVGVVVLKKLSLALRDGDRIVAVLKGSAINNDGSRKVGFTAPSVEGQASVIRAALESAGVEGVGYVEAHGTGTALGDPIEVRALSQALGGGRHQPVWIGSVKTNIGHLDTAAGVAGFIKAALAVEQGEIPPSLHYSEPNPQIDFSSFTVVEERRVWEEEGPRRAGVSAFGIGGTNAHAVLEQAPVRKASGPSRQYQLLVWSAKTESALAQMTTQLGEHLSSHPEQSLADVAFTLAQGRRRFGHRRALVCATAEEAGRGWEEAVAERGESPPPVVFLFPGQGSVYPGMGEDLYRQEKVFREAIERCRVERLYGPDRWTADELVQTQNAQPALFAVCYALAELWRSWGLEPWAMLGHSLGEYVAATLAGVLELEAALELVHLRGTLMGRLPRGAMLSVELSADEAKGWIDEEVSLAAENGPRLSVLSGTTPAIARVEAALAAQGVSCRRLATSHAFHSAMMEPMLEAFGSALGRVKLSAPRRRYLSCLSGTWIRAEEATDPGYWVRHLREPVRFSAALAELLGQGRVACVEAGPGRSLSSLVRKHPSKSADSWVLGSLPPAESEEPDGAFVLRSLGRYWLAGGGVDWPAFFAGEERRREPLPPYPFERQRYWLGGLGAPATEVETIAAPPSAQYPPARSQRPRLPTAYVAPTTETERRLVEIWQSLLGVTPIGVDDDFFELGGHSLLGTQVMSRLSSAFGRQLPLRLLFEAPTVARLAAQLAQGDPAEEPAMPLQRMPPISRPELLPLSFAQQRLWFLDQLDPGNPAYNLAFAVRAVGDLRPDRLARAFGEICRRHEVLRTRFVVDRGQPVQRIAAEPAFQLRVVDLTGLPAAERAAELQCRMASEARHPFDLSEGPLLRALVLRLDSNEHVVVTTLHHIVADGWSLGLLLSELGIQYRDPSSLPELAVQYADYALWQRQWLAGENLERRLGYWKEQLGGELAALELPTDHPRPAVPSFDGADLRFTLPPALSAAVSASGRRHGATLFMTLLAAFQALLHRYTGQTDVVVGSPVANRDRVEIEPLIGCFVNTLALRADLTGDPSFERLLERTRGVALEAQAHQDVPFELLVQELKPERDMSRTPLFQAFFALQNAPLGAIELPGVTLQPEVLGSRSAAFDLSLSMAGGEEGLRGVLNYRLDLFEEPTMRRLLAHFERLLAAAVESPALPISRLPLLSPAERHQTLAEWQAVPAAPGGSTLHGLFEAQAGERPGAVALLFEDERLTYGDLDRRANQLARYLRELGAGPGSTVGICLERSPALVVALLAVLKCGAAYLPLDPSYPEPRLAFMLEDSGARLAIAQGDLLAGFAGRRVDLEQEAAVIAKQQATRMPIEVPAAGLAYLLYTSGSTGRPKGVEVPHGAVVQFLAAMREAPGLDAGDTLAAVTTLSFDIAVLEIFLPLAVGARVALVSREEAAEPRELARRLRLAGATVMQATPATWQLLADSGWNNPSGLRVLCGGEALPRALADTLLACSPEVWNLYGPTEATVWCAAERVAPGHGAPAIGRPIAGTRLLVLDGEGSPAPIGVPGEILIGGAGLARGYHGRPELTAAAFVPDPAAPEPGARLYRTGDLGRVLPDGRLQVLGRRDHQVKVRGFRIELGEIETALDRHPGVRQAVVVARPLRAGDSHQLVAYVVAGGGEPGAEELRRFLAETLPAHLLPTAWVFLAELPRTPNGKVDRRALPAPGSDRPDGEATYVAPRNPAEEAVAEIWSEVLGVERVGVHDSFFALGGHSLLATQVTSRVFETFQVDLPLRRLFAQPTVAGVAEAILAEQLGHLSEEERSLLASADELTEEQLEAQLARMKEQDRG